MDGWMYVQIDRRKEGLIIVWMVWIDRWYCMIDRQTTQECLYPNDGMYIYIYFSFEISILLSIKSNINDTIRFF